MNQNFYNSNSSGSDQSQPPQFPVNHQPPQETSIEILHDQENAINSMQNFLRKFNQLFRELLNDVQNIHEELDEYINTPSWNRHVFNNNDDDDDEDCTIAITPDFLITDSLSMGDEHLDTILATESDKFIVFRTVPQSQIDSLLAEFTDALIFLKSIPSGIDEADYDPEEDIHLVKRLLYDNSSPRPPEEFVSKNSNANTESFFPSPIPNENCDSFIEEIDLFLTPDDPMPPALRKMIMTLKWIFQSLKNCLKSIPFHSMKMSHTILIFLHPIVLLQNHQMLSSIPGNVKTLAKGFCTQVFISSASYWESPIQI
nr:hypothetical protein [Tanacetum cinerariifolium]